MTDQMPSAIEDELPFQVEEFGVGVNPSGQTEVRLVGHDAKIADSLSRVRWISILYACFASCLFCRDR